MPAGPGLGSGGAEIGTGTEIKLYRFKSFFKLYTGTSTEFLERGKQISCALNQIIRFRFVHQVDEPVHCKTLCLSAEFSEYSSDYDMLLINYPRNDVAHFFAALQQSKMGYKSKDISKVVETLMDHIS